MPSAKSESPGASSPSIHDGAALERVGKLAAIAEALEGMSAPELIGIIMDEAGRDTELRNRLGARLAPRPAENTDAREWRARIERVTTIGPDMFSDLELRAFRKELKAIAGALDGMAGRTETAADALELIELAITRLDAVIHEFEDPRGDIGEILDQLGESHIIAARRARPEPIAFAERLLALQLAGNWNTFDAAYESYAQVLGAEGRERYRVRATEAWQTTPRGRRKTWDRSYVEPRIDTIMKDIARVDGNREMTAEIRASQFTTLREFENLASEFQRRGQHEQAVEWAERGLRAFPRYSSHSLRHMLLDEYPLIGRHDEMMRIALDGFSRSPNLGTYQYLKARTEKAGNWGTLREKMLELARKDAEPIHEDGRESREAMKDSSVVVEILLDEGDAERAWREAIDGDCRDALWIELAAARAADAPEDALAAYQSLVDKWIDAGTRYEEAVELIGKMRDIMYAIGQGPEFAEYMAELRSAQKRKRKLIELLGDL